MPEAHTLLLARIKELQHKLLGESLSFDSVEYRDMEAESNRIQKKIMTKWLVLLQPRVFLHCETYSTTYLTFTSYILL